MTRPVKDFSLEKIELIHGADLLRKDHPGCGVDKIYDTLQPDWIGKTKGIKLLYSYGFKLHKRVNYKRTTIPVSSHYQNLIEGMLVTSCNQVWQTDITYIKVNGQFYYLVFIVDIYTKQILGFTVNKNMQAEANLDALKQACKSQEYKLEGLVHHSDRGSQYIDHRYIAELSKQGIWISMGYKAQDNAYAERLNGIIKNEFLKRWTIKDFNGLKRKVKKAVEYYNGKRIHRHLPGKQTPDGFREGLVHLTTQTRPKVIIYTNGNKKLKVASSHLELYPDTKPRAPICPMVIR